jgi:hypothetical protein
MSMLIGNTIARYGNPFHTYTLAGANLIFYQYTEKDVASRKPSWGWTATEQSAVSTAVLGSAQVGNDGSYQVNLESYHGGYLLVALQVESFAYAPSTNRSAYGLIGFAQPQRDEQAEAFKLDVDLPKTSYCDILKALDLWLVSGRVTDCGKQPVPLVGATVKVFDRDITQDDFLGEGLTDATGSFAVFFSSPAFKAIPSLPPPWDVIPPHELFGGPDVFFHVNTGTINYLTEDPSMGRTSGRENVPNCSYHELCAEPAWQLDKLTLWTEIGDYRVPDSGSLHDFDADGLTTAGKLAFTGNIDFIGQLSQTYLSEAMSFRFMYAEWADMATAPTYPGDFDPLLSDNINLNMAYGSIYTSTGPGPFDFTLDPVKPEPDTDGWIAVDQNTDFIRDTGRLIQVKTASLVPSLGNLEVMEGIADAGVEVPAGPLRDRPRKFSFVLEIKTASHTAYQPIPVPIHINNSWVYLRHDLTELQSNVCSAVTPSGGSITVHQLYTVAHPYLQYYRINLRRQGGSNLVVKNEDHSTHAALWTDTTGDFGTETAVYTDIGKCSYRSHIVADRRLTNGYTGVTHQDVLRTFCVD